MRVAGRGRQGMVPLIRCKDKSMTNPEPDFPDQAELESYRLYRDRARRDAALA